MVSECVSSASPLDDFPKRNETKRISDSRPGGVGRGVAWQPCRVSELSELSSTKLRSYAARGGSVVIYLSIRWVLGSISTVDIHSTM